MLITIIMAVYNNERYFPLAVKSVIQQDYSDWELIIIDDGSTDRTSFIADEIGKSDHRITIIHQKNQWIYASFNTGIEAAKGEYIYILNSDDRLRPGTLRLMADKAITYNPDIIWTKVLMHECDTNQNILSYDIKGFNRLVTEEKFFPDQETVRSNWPYVLFTSLAQNQANLYRAELMKKYRYRTDIYGADTLFNISIAPEVKSAFVMKEPVYDFFVYTQTETNASIRKYYPYEHDMFNEIYDNYTKLFSEWKLPIESYQKKLINKRIAQVTTEIHSLLCKDCTLSTEKKLEHILWKIPDELVKECAKLSNKEEELESRILSGIRELFLQEQILKESKMYFVFELLEVLLYYEKDKDDIKRLEAAIENPYNYAHIGQVFYNKLKGQNRLN